MSNSRPLVTIVLAAHDAATTLGLAVESLLRQTLRELEVVVVDDCSQDESPGLLSAIDDSRVVVFRNEEQLGLAASLNRGLDHAAGRYVARLDADDVALPTRLERQLAAMRARPGLAVVGTSVLELHPGKRPGPARLMPVGEAAVRWRALFSAPFLHPTVMLDLELLDRNGLRYDPACLESEDYDLWARLLAIGDGDNLSAPLVLYRRHPGQASERRRALQRSVQLRVALKQIAEVAPELGAEAAELAWLLGAAEPVPAERLPEAAEAFVALVHGYERRRPEHRRVVRHEAARALAGAALRTGDARARLLGLALRLDPALPLRLPAARRRRAAVGRAAAREARSWLVALGAPQTALPAGEPARVAVVSPEPTPYRAPLFDRVAVRPDLELSVIYAARTVASRTWEVEPRHDALFLRGVRVPGVRGLFHHDYPLTPGIWRALGRTRPDCVVVSGWSTFASQAAVVWCRLRRVPYLLIVESHDEGPRPGWRRFVKGTVVPWLVRRSAGALVTGKLARESMIARGARPEQVRVFANTIDVEGWGERSDRLAARRPELRAELGVGADDVVVVSVARLAPEKGMDTLIRAVAKAGEPRLVLVLVGDGPERESLASLARELGVSLALTGDRPWPRVAEAYVAADVFALLSEREPWAVVVNEAAACGLPLVLSDRVGAAWDLLRDGENGALVPAGDVAAAAAALRTLATDRDARVRAGARSRTLARAWGYGQSVESFAAAVHEAVADARYG